LFIEAEKMPFTLEVKELKFQCTSCGIPIVVNSGRITIEQTAQIVCPNCGASHAIAAVISVISSQDIKSNYKALLHQLSGEAEIELELLEFEREIEDEKAMIKNGNSTQI
jgi:transcription elongation factor Elf1